MAGSRNILIVGSSSGGPRILERLFEGMPELNASIIVIHQMVKPMNKVLQDTMAAKTKMPVVIANHGDRLEHGKVYVAPSDVHLKVMMNNVIELVPGEKVNNVCPSIDVALKSLHKFSGDVIVAVILTGQGQDGAEGIRHVKTIGGTTIAQDLKTSPIPAMPKAAIDTGCVDSVLTPEDIRDRVVGIFGSVRNSTGATVAFSRRN